MQGSMDVGDVRILKTGVVMMSEPLTLYGPHIAGAEGCVTLEIFSNHRASHTTYVEGPSGELVECDLWTAEGAMRMAENIKQQEAVLGGRSEEHTSELQSLMRISYAVFCLKKKKNIKQYTIDERI